uniref:Uncharacterized protein n=1 Tax=Suricata suricatta TaxID=37032 RepID=A0A673STP7_SURSU
IDWWIRAGKGWSQVYFLVHRWNQCLDMTKEAVCLQLILFHGLLQNDVLITFSSSRNFNSRVQTINLKNLHFHSCITSLK